MLPNQFIEEVTKLADERPMSEVRVRIGDVDRCSMYVVENVVIGPHGLEIVVAKHSGRSER